MSNIATHWWLLVWKKIAILSVFNFLYNHSNHSLKGVWNVHIKAIFNAIHSSLESKHFLSRVTMMTYIHVIPYYMLPCNWTLYTMVDKRYLDWRIGISQIVGNISPVRKLFWNKSTIDSIQLTIQNHYYSKVNTT